jgi:hypothetical protein
MTDLLKQQPDFMIIGAMKAGTTALFNYLSLHPQVKSPKRKELHYYDRSRYQGLSLSEYINSFPRRENNILSGEATPFYLRHPHAPRWIASDFAHIKLIVLLRNPTDRAYSHYQQRVNNGKEQGSLADAIALEQKSMDKEWQQFSADEKHLGKQAIELSYLSRGRYLEQIKNWLKFFPSEQMLIVFTEELLRNQLKQLNRVTKFLAIDPFPDDFTQAKVNTRHYNAIDGDTKAQLDGYFEPHNHALFSFLGIDSLW